MAKVGKLGRIVIPKEYREKLGIELEGEIDISLSDGALTIKPKVINRCICQRKLGTDATIPLCDGCISFISKNRK